MFNKEMLIKRQQPGFLEELEDIAERADKKFPGKKHTCLEVVRGKNPMAEIFLGWDDCDYLHVNYIKSGLSQNEDDHREFFNGDKQLRDKLVEVIDEMLGEKIPGTKEKLEFIKSELLKVTGTIKMFSLDNTDKAIIGTGVVGTGLVASGLGHGKFKQTRKKLVGEANDNFHKRISDLMKAEDSAVAKVRENVGRRIDNLYKNKTFKNKGVTSKALDRAIDRAHEMGNSEIKGIQSNTNALWRAAKTKHSVALGKAGKAAKNSGLKRAGVAGAIGLGATGLALGARHLYKKKNKQFSEDTEYLKTVAGAGGALGGAAMLSKVNKDGEITGRVKRYHATDESLINKIKQEGLRSNKANGNTYTKKVLGHIKEEELNNKVYVGKKKSVAEAVSDGRSYNGYGKQGMLYIDADYDDWKKLKKTSNPELLGAKNGEDFARKVLRTQQGINYDTLGPVSKEISKKQGERCYKMLGEEGTEVIAGDVSSKFIKGGKGYEKNSLRKIAKYAKNNPKRFAKGIGKAAAGAALVAGGVGLAVTAGRKKKN